MAGRTTKPYIDWPVQQNIKVATPFYINGRGIQIGKARLVMTLKDSKDEKVRAAGVEVKTGRKWSASKAVTEAESRLRHKDIVGTVAEGIQGLGTSKSCYWNKANAQERRNLVQREIKCSEEKNRQTKIVELGSQGA